MATIDSKEIALTLLQNDGYYTGDPQIASMYSYVHTHSGDKLYGIYYSPRDQGPWGDFCRDIKLLWKQADGLTEEGEQELKELLKGKHEDR